MASDIPPLAPVNPSPLVREKRRFHGEHQQSGQQGSSRNRASTSSDQDPDEAPRQPKELSSNTGKSTDNAVNQDEKHATVRHLDEYV